MSALEAARLGDQIGHTCAMKGLLAGLVIGFVVTGLVLLAVGATVATGGAAAVVIGALIAGTAAGGVGGEVLKLIAGALGCEPSADAITMAVAQDPAAAAKLKELEMNNDLEIKRLDQALQIAPVDAGDFADFGRAAFGVFARPAAHCDCAADEQGSS